MQPPKPVGLYVAEGNPNRLTKAEIARRQEAEEQTKLGKAELGRVKAPDIIKNDANAMKQWKQLLKDYKEAAERGLELLTSSDIGTLAIYCKTYAEYEALQQINRYELGFEAMLKLETAINKKADLLTKLADRLYLNPAARVRNVPKAPKEDKPKSKFGKFGGGA